MEDQNHLEVSPESQSVFSPPKIPFIERHGISPILFAFFSLIIIFILYQIVGGLITFVVYGYKPTAANLFGYRLATGFGQIIFILIPTLVLVRFITFDRKEYLRLKLPNIKAFIVPLVGIFSLQQMLQIYLVFQERIPIPESLQSSFQQFKELFEELYKQLVVANSISELLWVSFVVALIPAFAEELLFRGLVQRSFEKGLTPTKGVVLTGVIFGAYHLNPFSFIPLAVIGIYLGFLTMRSESIWVSVVTHFFNNLFACIALYLNFDDDYVIVGKAGNLSLGNLMLVFWFFGVIFLISTYFFLKITKPIKQLNIFESTEQ